MKKHIALLGISLFLFSSTYGQTAWLNDFELAKALAKQNNKLIMIDFWATWCGPCKTMDREVWNTEEGAELSKKFISLKIDIDINKALAMQYNIRSIPAVLFVDATGETIIDQIGFSHKSDILSLMEELPGEVAGLNQALALWSEENESQSRYLIALEFQELGKNSNSRKIINAFFAKCDDHLRKAAKNSDDNAFLQKIELTEIENLVARGSHKRALKKLDKNKDDYPDVQDNEAYINYLYVLAYIGVGDKNEEQKYYQALEARSDGKNYIDILTKAKPEN